MFFFHIIVVILLNKYLQVIQTESNLRKLKQLKCMILHKVTVVHGATTQY